MAKGHLLLVDTRDGFFEEGSARDGRWGPGGVATGTSVGKGGSCRGRGRRYVKDGGRCES